LDEIVCLRTVEIPAEHRAEFLAWIEEMRPLRQRMGCLMERVLEPAGHKEETLYLTIWKDSATFDAWILTPEHEQVSRSRGHSLVKWHPIRRYVVPGGW
jgi:heme-degrading monooxygenase HmoA